MLDFPVLAPPLQRETILLIFLFEPFYLYNYTFNILQAGVAITDEGLLVGESDGLGFGVGVAPKSAKADPSAVVQLRRKEREKDRRSRMSRDAKR